MWIYWAVAVLLIVNIPFYLWLFKYFFADKEDFKESLHNLFRLDIISLMKGDFLYDLKAQLKIKFFFLLCLTVVLTEVILANELYKLYTQ